VAVELLVEKADPTAEDLFGLGGGVGLVCDGWLGLGISSHTIWTINQAGGMRRVAVLP
jgi:hypothetical protein